MAGNISLRVKIDKISNIVLLLLTQMFCYDMILNTESMVGSLISRNDLGADATLKTGTNWDNWDPIVPHLTLFLVNLPFSNPLANVTLITTSTIK